MIYVFKYSRTNFTLFSSIISYQKVGGRGLLSALFVPVPKSLCHVQSHQKIFKPFLTMVVASECAVVLGRARSSAHAGVSALAASVTVNVCLFAGSQQSQDQTSRRSGNTGEKHNENGVRLHEHYLSDVQHETATGTLYSFGIRPYM